MRSQGVDRILHHVQWKYLPISARRQLNELSDEMAVKISILFYADAREALIKALGD